MRRIFTLLCTLILLTACAEITHNEYTFNGESEHWEAEYSYKGTETWGEDDGTKTYSNEDSYEFVLKYKGSLEDLSSIQKLEYCYRTNSNGGQRTEEFTEPPTTLIFTSRGASKGGAKVSEDEVIQVNIKWDDLEESILLNNKGKN
ncbi:hypothetical protein [Psychrobacillus vulpis]|uniref:Lipoprotein n=1 Tax=Psychrobacillus vulpis TaxID=2325572 RepID=A0A544TPP3_9BACI|nr:hypothetical protein [Psychrobacillus vulpis]TQR19413.1 hypothetical protein FG384_12235 [Psychrobacillus vulpis]